MLRQSVMPRVQIYHASEEYGIEDIRTSGGYFHLGKVFHELSRDDVAESMFDRVGPPTAHCNAVPALLLVNSSYRMFVLEITSAF